MSECNDDLSSSEDENMNEALKEATDPEFLASLFDENKSEIKLNESQVSCNITNERLITDLYSGRDDKYDNSGVSQSYKEFVNKKLYELLDGNFKLTEIMLDINKNDRKKKSRGIKLLTTSGYVNVPDEAITNIVPSMKRKYVDVDSAENMLRCQEVAVNEELIGAKIGIESWNERPKGTVFKYKKMSDGTLIEQ